MTDKYKVDNIDVKNVTIMPNFLSNFLLVQEGDESEFSMPRKLSHNTTTIQISQPERRFSNDE